MFQVKNSYSSDLPGSVGSRGGVHGTILGCQQSMCFAFSSPFGKFSGLEIVPLPPLVNVRVWTAHRKSRPLVPWLILNSGLQLFCPEVEETFIKCAECVPSMLGSSISHLNPCHNLVEKVLSNSLWREEIEVSRLEEFLADWMLGCYTVGFIAVVLFCITLFPGRTHICSGLNLDGVLKIAEKWLGWGTNGAGRFWGMGLGKESGLLRITDTPWEGTSLLVGVYQTP